MRRCLAAAAAPGEAPLELFSGLSSALPERANGDASPTIFFLVPYGWPGSCYVDQTDLGL